MINLLRVFDTGLGPKLTSLLYSENSAAPNDQS